MTESLLGRFPSLPRKVSEHIGESLCGGVVEMGLHNVPGQVLQDLIHYTNNREMGGVMTAHR